MFSGKSSTSARSVAAMSDGSPERAAHRKGPLPWQKSGRMYFGTKPSIWNASAMPAFTACARMLLP